MPYKLDPKITPDECFKSDIPVDYRKKYKVGQEFPLLIVAKGVGELPADDEEEYPCTIVEVRKDEIVVEDEEGRYITLGAPPKVH